MGKRSSFDRVERDFYPTPYSAVVPLLPYLQRSTLYLNKVSFCEPCAGEGDLVRHLTKNNIQVTASYDIQLSDKFPYAQQKDALTLTKEDLCGADYIITNPPWDRTLLHPMIERFKDLAPTWLLFDADWMHTKQSSELIKYCSMIISIGRVKWIPDSKNTGKDNCCWYLFQDELGAYPVFVGRQK